MLAIVTCSGVHGRMITQHAQAKHVCMFTINDTFELSDLHEACWSIIVELYIARHMQQAQR